MFGVQGLPSKCGYRKRLYHDRSNTVNALRVDSFALTPLKLDNLIKVEVTSDEQYSSQCAIPSHRNCMGHICVSGGSPLLFPGGMCTVTGSVKDEIFQISCRYLNSVGDSVRDEYARELRSLVLGKKGILRGKCCSGTVEGSMRMVIVPCWDIDRDEILVPEYTRDTVKVPTKLKCGLETPIYGYEGISEGDYAIVIRPPCLWEGNVQPKRIRFWDRTAIGICPEVCESYHADFDGDEMQIYILKERRSQAECSKWQFGTRQVFNYDLIRQENPELGSDYKSKFMNNTSVCLQDVLDGVRVTYTMKCAKVKSELLKMVSDLVETGDSEESFFQSSVQGMRDVMRQQLTQGEVGRILRLSRVNSQDILASPFGSHHIEAADRDYHTTPFFCGLPAARLVSRIGSGIQQNLLDSHRARVESIRRFDLASSFILDRNETLLICTGPALGHWHAQLDKNRFLCEVPCQFRADPGLVLGSYSSTILARIPLPRRVSVAVTGLVFLCSYMGVVCDSVEIQALAELLVIRSERGLAGLGDDKRTDMKARWLTRVVATHWNTLEQTPKLLQRRYHVSTVVESCVFGNFSRLPSALDCPRTLHAGFD